VAARREPAGREYVTIAVHAFNNTYNTQHRLGGLGGQHRGAAGRRARAPNPREFALPPVRV